MEEGSSGRSCEEHGVCGYQLELDSVVRFRKVQIVDEDDGVEETAIAAYWVTDGVDRCRVGFLGRHAIVHWKKFDGKLAQIVDIYSKDDESPTKRRKYHRNKGCAQAVIIDTVRSDDEEEGKKKARVSSGNNSNNGAAKKARVR